MPLTANTYEMQTSSPRNLRIDFLRGVAILSVLVLHFTLAYGVKNSVLAGFLPLPWVRAITLNGNFGVTIFFVISGYLITANSLVRWGALKNIQARVFYALRAARILPCLALALTVIVILGVRDVPFFSNSDGGHSLPASYFLVAAVSVLSFWHNVLMQHQGYFNYCLNIYWSLSVEEMFYLALPLVCLLLRKTSLIVLVGIATIIIGPLYRSQHSENELFFMYGYFACFDAIAFGCLTALLAQRYSFSVLAARVVRLGAGLGLALVYLRGIDGHEIFGFTLIALFSALFVLASANNNSLGWCNSRWTAALRWMGRHSYEIYLFHIIVLGLMRNVCKTSPTLYLAKIGWLALFMMLTALVAALISRYVSEPANAWLRRRFVANCHRREIADTPLAKCR